MMTTLPIPVPHEENLHDCGLPMRVLYCIPTLGGGGAERQVRLLLPEFARRGVPVALLTRFASLDIETLSSQGVHCIPLESHGHYSPAIAVSYLRAIRTFRPKVIQSFLTQMDIICGAMPSGEARWILSERSSEEAYGGRLGRTEQLKNGLRSWLGARADLVIANSPSGLPVWRSHRSKMVIPNAIDFDAIEAAHAGQYRENEVFAGRRTLLSIGRLVPEKKMQVLIEATDEIRKKVPAFRLVIVGEGPERSNLENLIETRGLGDHVRLAGYRLDVIRWLKAAELFASASSFEGQPNAVLEAAAAGVPMVLSDIRQHRDSVGEGAAFFKPGDPAACAEKVVVCLNSPEAAQQLAGLARCNIEHLSVAQVADRYLDAYQHVLAEAVG